METEIWKPIIWYEGLYEISNLSNIRRIKWSERCKSNRNLKKKMNNKWYYIVSLSKKSKKSAYTVHRILAKLFIPNPNNFPIVMHLDNNPLNNSIDNLKWWTTEENMQQMWDEKRHKICNPNKWKFWKDNHNSVKVYQYNLNWDFIKLYHWIADANRYTSINKTSIWLCCRGIQKTAWWFIWRYNLIYNK